MPKIAAQADDKVTVVRLGVRAELSANGAGKAQCQAVEYATLSDDQEVTLTNDRGWGGGLLNQTTIENAVRNTLTCLLPDDAEETGEQHEWPKFLDALDRVGVSTTAEALRGLPFTVGVSTTITLPIRYAI